MTAVAEYESHGGEQRPRARSLWPWVGIYATAGAILTAAAIGAWRLVNHYGVQFRIWNIAGVAVLSIGAIVAFSLALWCMQRMLEKMPRQWVWGVTLLVIGLACEGVLAKIYFDARKNDPAARLSLLTAAIALGIFGVLVLGQSIRCNRIFAEGKVRPWWQRWLWAIYLVVTILCQLDCAIAAVGAGIVLGFGYPVP